MSGWISLHRKIMDHPFYTEKRKFSRYEAWIDLIMLANHQDNKFMLGNQLVEVKRGSFITSELKLMDKWDWGKEKVRGFLKLLESDGMIIREAKKYTLITICNYEKHSSKSDRNEPSDSNGLEDVADRQQTDSRPTADREPYTNNNVNNNKEKDMPDFDKFWSLYPRKIEKADALTAWGNVIKRGGLPEDILRAVEIYKTEIKKDKTETTYIKHPASFLNKDRWKEKLIVPEPMSKKHTNVYELPLNLSPELIEKMRVDQEQAVKDFYDLSKLGRNDYPDTFKLS